MHAYRLDDGFTVYKYQVYSVKWVKLLQCMHLQACYNIHLHTLKLTGLLESMNCQFLKMYM